MTILAYFAKYAFSWKIGGVDTGVGGVSDDPEEPISIINIGEQRARGLDFSARYTISDQLTLGISGSLMDAVLSAFRIPDVQVMNSITLKRLGVMWILRLLI